MLKPVFLFSGQGSQYPGMGRELCGQYGCAARTYEKASDILGYDVLKLSCGGSAQELAKTLYSQPLIYTLSMAACAVLMENGVAPAAVAGFSLGECSALAAAGAMDAETGFRVINARARAMQKAAESSDGAMYAVIGPSAQEIEAACSQADGYVIPVNYNCPGQIVIAGECGAAQRAADALKDSGARVVRLAVNAAFHSRLMLDAAGEFYAQISQYKYAVPRIGFYSNVTGGRAQIDDIPLYLKGQMTSPVRFIDETGAMSRDGIDAFIELGPGRALCGFIRKGIQGAATFNVEDPKSLEKCLAAARQQG
ncbi:MAG: ACP S-malonyltransferase [Clostridia bacterium]|nr:ACP S-malonyltransferase [Clostridia bacterium]